MMLGQKKIDRGFAGILKKNSLKIFFRAKKNETKKKSTSPTIIYRGFMMESTKSKQLL